MSIIDAISPNYRAIIKGIRDFPSTWAEVLSVFVSNC